MAQLQAECRARGYLPFVNFNRVHVVPPCNVSADEVAEGLAILDDVFTALAPHYAGA
jgi:taurine--2-oxoglutarate transaminase